MPTNCARHPVRVAEMWRPFLELGFTHVIADIVAPFDHETIERLPRLRALVGGARQEERR